mmetsp:Transcript_58519/g.154361  ORF Transcript_58519/g.154361 Transcript_58519/m.154361 type:complete len:207 (-) Transcript_58519:643-1263(-)
MCSADTHPLRQAAPGRRRRASRDHCHLGNSSHDLNNSFRQESRPPVRLPGRRDGRQLGLPRQAILPRRSRGPRRTRGVRQRRGQEHLRRHHRRGCRGARAGMRDQVPPPAEEGHPHPQRAAACRAGAVGQVPHEARGQAPAAGRGGAAQRAGADARGAERAQVLRRAAHRGADGEREGGGCGPCVPVHGHYGGAEPPGLLRVAGVP